MVKFTTPLETTPAGPGRWRVVAPLECETPFGVITVPSGFVTDGASVPKVLWNVFPPFDGDYDAAAVLHDYAYQHATALKLTRAQADSLLRDGMVATETAAWKRRAIYTAVRVGGYLAWLHDREKEAQ